MNLQVVDDSYGSMVVIRLHEDFAWFLHCLQSQDNVLGVIVSVTQVSGKEMEIELFFYFTIKYPSKWFLSVCFQLVVM